MLSPGASGPSKQVYDPLSLSLSLSLTKKLSCSQLAYLISKWETKHLVNIFNSGRLNHFCSKCQSPEYKVLLILGLRIDFLLNWENLQALVIAL